MNNIENKIIQLELKIDLILAKLNTIESKLDKGFPALPQPIQIQRPKPPIYPNLENHF